MKIYYVFILVNDDLIKSREKNNKKTTKYRKSTCQSINFGLKCISQLTNGLVAQLVRAHA